MYAAVPRIVPTFVIIAGDVIVGESARRTRLMSVRRFCQPEVQDLHIAIKSQRDIRRLEIAMNDPFIVSGMERLGDLARHGQRFVHREWSAHDTIGQRRALDELHDERTYEVSAFGGTFLKAVQLRDVWMVQRSEDLRFTLKPRNAFGVVSEVVGKDLDRHIATQLRVVRTIDLAHSPGAKLHPYLDTPIRVPERGPSRDYGMRFSDWQAVDDIMKVAPRLPSSDRPTMDATR